MGIKPGWIALAVVTLLALVLLLQLSAARQEVGRLNRELATLKQERFVIPVSEKKKEAKTHSFSLPIPGVCLPKTADNLPAAPRPYRKGTNPGFVFTSNDACVPVFYRTGVIAAASGEVIKAEASYKESTPAEFAALLKAVAGGANSAQMDKLRGREVWIRHPGGATTVYAHLSSIAPRIRVGSKVEKGEWVGLVGNSGTSAGVNSTRENPRLLFELWEGQPDGSKFMGQGETAQTVKARAVEVFGLR